MERPKELDVPHWAKPIVDNYRERLNLPTRITDRMIYARVSEGETYLQRMVISLVHETEGM